MIGPDPSLGPQFYSNATLCEVENILCVDTSDTARGKVSSSHHHRSLKQEVRRQGLLGLGSQGSQVIFQPSLLESNAPLSQPLFQFVPALSFQWRQSLLEALFSRESLLL